VSEKRPLKVCLTCSVGGHFKQMLALKDAWASCDVFYVLMYKPVIETFRKKNRVYIVTSPERNPFLFARNIIESLIIFARTRPDVVVSTGAGVTIALCYIAKLFRRKVVYIEDWCIVDVPSVTGRALYPVADLFIIQREQLRRFYPRAVYGGELF
jgi:UDP-N-acetylglucosamine:LPS N-acetylglucosamine transferase